MAGASLEATLIKIRPENSLLLQAIQSLKTEVLDTMNTLLKMFLEQRVELKLSVEISQIQLRLALITLFLCRMK